MYGTRHPRIAGLIRFNEEISHESKRHVFASLFDKNPVVDLLGPVDTIEVVSDDTVMRSHDRNHIEAGVGVLIKTGLSVPSPTGPIEIPCALITNCSHVGATNDCKQFHSNQARVVCEHYGEEWLGTRGLLVTAHRIGGDDAAEISVSEGSAVVTELYSVDFPITRVDFTHSNLTVESVTARDRINLLSNFVHFPSLLASASVESFALVDPGVDVVLCGVSTVVCKSGLVATDAYVTVDCPSGTEEEMLGVIISRLASQKGFNRIKLTLSKNDAITTIFNPDRLVTQVVLSAVPIALTEMEQRAVMKAPWAMSGLFA